MLKFTFITASVISFIYLIYPITEADLVGMSLAIILLFVLHDLARTKKRKWKIKIQNGE